MITLDIDDDEDFAEELVGLYDESRRAVDRLVPRIGYNQANWLLKQNASFTKNWLKAHDFVYQVRRGLLEYPNE